MKDVLDETPPVISTRGAITLGLAAAAALAICYNALIGQTARHPAPLGDGWSDAPAARPSEKRAKPAAVGKTPTKQNSSVPVSEDLRRLQSQLAHLGYYKGAIDGRQGDGLRAAITAYQTDRGLEPSGSATPALREQVATDLAFLNASRFGATQPSRNVEGEAPSEAMAPAANKASVEPAATASVNAGRTDPTREQVARVQKGLAELGYQPGPADGLIGAQTREAIMQFQRDRELPVTGRVDEALLKELSKVTGLSSLNEA
ncbi:peptidoglycan-binding domain-containing protein [Rhodoligotrophos defluvii]|uniref:peptidoglycan-binding domain-containing protein n=1 Tax=Rhodoligotrophos defluvii TaxID=2561934 RepID=UPI0010C9CF0C|nr:peptidoglycan-binding domain-containing protein [Rhodoligotrophos defluvii]